MLTQKYKCYLIKFDHTSKPRKIYMSPNSLTSDTYSFTLR